MKKLRSKYLFSLIAERKYIFSIVWLVTSQWRTWQRYTVSYRLHSAMTIIKKIEKRQKSKVIFKPLEGITKTKGTLKLYLHVNSWPMCQVWIALSGKLPLQASWPSRPEREDSPASRIGRVGPARPFLSLLFGFFTKHKLISRVGNLFKFSKFTRFLSPSPSAPQALATD